MKPVDSREGNTRKEARNILFICSWCALAALIIVLLAGTVVPLAGCESGDQKVVEDDDSSRDSEESSDDDEDRKIYMIRPVAAARMSRAKGTLRSLGSSQLAYQYANNQREYGTYENLRDNKRLIEDFCSQDSMCEGLADNLYLVEDYTPDNMIDNYHLLWEVERSGDLYGELGTGIGNSRFTIIAFPDEGYGRYLNTFAVTEDQVVRVFNPDSDWRPNIFDSVQSWDPIL